MGVIVGMRRVCLCGDAGEWLACMIWARGRDTCAVWVVVQYDALHCIIDSQDRIDSFSCSFIREHFEETTAFIH